MICRRHDMPDRWHSAIFMIVLCLGRACRDIMPIWARPVMLDFKASRLKFRKDDADFLPISALRRTQAMDDLMA